MLWTYSRLLIRRVYEGPTTLHKLASLFNLLNSFLEHFVYGFPGRFGQVLGGRLDFTRQMVERGATEPGHTLQRVFPLQRPSAGHLRRAFLAAFEQIGRFEWGPDQGGRTVQDDGVEEAEDDEQSGPVVLAIGQVFEADIGWDLGWRTGGGLAEADGRMKVERRKECADLLIFS
jgi:hypothetical protein